MRGTNTLLLGILFLISGLVPGCLGTKGVSLPFGGGAPDAPPDSADAQLASLEHRVARLEESQADLDDLFRGMNAGLSAQLEDLSAQITALSEKISAQERWVATLARSQAWQGAVPPAADLLPATDSSAVLLDGVGMAPAGLAAAREQARRLLADSIDAVRAPTVRVAARDDRSLLPDPPEEGIRLYEVAYADLKRDNFQLALINLRAFLERYSATSLADNAQYWIGEAYYAQGQYEIAIEEFRKVVDQHPGQDKEAAAYFKIALSFKALGDAATAKRYLRFTIDRFPETREAKLAREKLAGF